MGRIFMAWITSSVGVVSEHRDDLEQISRTVGSEVQHLAIILIGCVESPVDRVHDVAVPDAVFASRLVDVHTGVSYRETSTDADRPTSAGSCRAT